jgi:hypothetical protein
LAVRDAARAGRIAVEICYCSVFDEFWLRKAPIEPKPFVTQACPPQKVKTDL